MQRVIFAALVVTVGLVGWLYWQQNQPRPFIASGFIEAERIHVVSRVGGRIAEVFVDEGSPVQADQQLFTIAPFDLREQQAQAEAQLAADQAELDRLKNGFRKEEIERARARHQRQAARLALLVAGPRKQEIETARAQVREAEAVLADAQFENQRIEDLVRRGGAAETEQSQATRALRVAEARLSAARQQLSLLEEGTRSEEIAEAQAAVAEARQALDLMLAGERDEVIAAAAARVAASRAQRAVIETRLRELTVYAPCDCVVETSDLDPGDFVSPDAPAIALVDPRDLWVRAYVPEARLGHVRIGQQVPIRVDSFPDRRFPAEIVFIARQAEFTPRNVQTQEERSKQVFRIKVRLREGQDRLRVGMAADVLFDESVDR